MDQDMLAELRTEAIDAVEDRLESLQEAVTARKEGRINDHEVCSTIRLEAHSIKSVAAGFDMKALKVTCHRFEDYFANVSEIDDKILREVQVYIDRMQECLEAFVNGREIDLSQMMRSVPNKGGFDVAEVMVSDIEVMLVMEPGTATKIVTRELLECGYRMINVANTIDAIQLIPAMKPDAVIISRTMPELSGIDLACALKAMPLTRDLPVALITTSERNSAELDDLPKSIPILRKSASFADDVADAFVSMGIL